MEWSLQTELAMEGNEIKMNIQEQRKVCKVKRKVNLKIVLFFIHPNDVQPG